MSAGPWTGEMVTRLTDMWAAGLSDSEIGRELGKTRNAVLGQVHRRGLPSRVTLQRLPHVVPVRPKKPRKFSMTIRRRAAVNVPAKLPMPKPEPVKLAADVWAPIPGTRPVSMDALDKGMCRWPIGEGRPFLFCGCETVDGASYCASHAARSKGPGTSYERYAVKDARAIVRAERRDPSEEGNSFSRYPHNSQ